MIGNSRLHWAWFIGTTLQQAWDTNPLPANTVERLVRCWTSGILPKEIFPPVLISQFSDTLSSSSLPLYLASVVPAQTPLWEAYPETKVITLADIPLYGLYPTLGIDRALALLGAGEMLGYPILVIDAGTALTFTGMDAEHQLIGGAILPGLGLQLQFLAKSTAALPSVSLPTQLPSRWAKQTSEAIESGVVYTVLAGIRGFIEDWQSQFPGSSIAITGGDAQVLLTYFKAQLPEIARQLTADPYLIFRGIRTIMSNTTS